MAPKRKIWYHPRLTSRDWTELPDGVMASILSCLGDMETLTAAEMVCKTWREICKDPRLWRTIDFKRNIGLFFGPPLPYDLVQMCRHAVDRSCGSFVYVKVDFFCTNELFKHVTNNSTGFIRHLSLFDCGVITDEALREAAFRLPLLEELDISMCKFSSTSLEVVGRSCPLLKSLKINDRFRRRINRYVKYVYYDDALAISGTMHNLLLLEIRGNELSCMGLGDILDCCPQLNSLDLRQCQRLKRMMSGELERRCAERIKKLWLPTDHYSESDFNLVARRKQKMVHPSKWP